MEESKLVVFWGLSMAANFFNWTFNLLAGRVLAKEELAALAVFLSFQYLLNVPAAALGMTVSRFTAFFRQKGEPQKHFYFFRQYWWFSWAVSLFFLSVFLLSGNFLKGFFGFNGNFLFWAFALIFIPLFLLSFETGVLLGQMAFVWVGFLYFWEALVKLLFLLLTPQIPALKVLFSPLGLAVLALPVSVAAAWAVSLFLGRSFHPLPTAEKIGDKEKFRETYRFLGNSFFVSLGLVLVYSLDVLLVNHYFSPSQAGVYAVLSLLGKVLFFSAGSFISLLIPLTARAQARGESTGRPLGLVLAAVFLIGGGIWLAYALAPDLTVRLLLGGRGLVALPYLTRYSLAMLFLSLAACLTAFGLAKKNYWTSFWLGAAAVLQGVLIVFFHQSLSEVVSVVFWTLLGLLLVVGGSEAAGVTPRSLLNNLKSFWQLFSFEGPKPARKKMKVLVFNWRDLKHCRAGGAEVYLQKIAEGLVKKNFAVTIFTANDGHCQAKETTGGVEIIRRGGFITVYFWAAVYFLFKFRGRFDVVIDSENGIPFFSPLYAGAPVILLVYHVHRDIFFRSLPPPFSWLAIFLEASLMPAVYRRSLVAAISQSTAEDLGRGIGLKADLIIPAGIDTEFFHRCPKKKTPQIIYLGRLKKYKSVGVLLEAFRPVAQKVPKARLVIAGEGDQRPFLENQTHRLGLERKVRFTGKVTEREKVKLLGESWVMVNPSYQEGWGMVCLEAGACGTPVLASRVDGLKEAVGEGESGYLFEYGNTEELSFRLKDLLADKEKREKLSKDARRWSEKFTWEKQVAKFEELLLRACGQNPKRAFVFRLKKEERWLKPMSR